MVFCFNHCVKNGIILSAIAMACTACGVRGPLTVNPPPIKGITAQQLSTPVDLRANPAANVLYSADGKKTNLPAPTAQ